MSPVIRFLPDDKQVRVKPGTTLFQAGRMARVAIRTRCGGNAACLMCKVRVADQSGLDRMSDKERNKLGTLREEGYRLACQARAVGNVTVVIPEDPLKAAIRGELARQRQEKEDLS
jgi:2Fe-2S ferredoxin